MRSLFFLLPAAITVGMVTNHAVQAAEMAAGYELHPIGQVKKSDNRTLIVLDKKYAAGLLGLDDFSHIYLFWWFDRNDTPEKRSILQVHPMGNQENPLTGVFATRSPVRPNLIAMTLCKIVSVKDNIIEIESTDAFDGTPVLDIKPFIPGYDTAEEAAIPEWLEKSRKKISPEQGNNMVPGHHGLHNVMCVSERIMSGSEPDGEEGFKSLEEMGVKTVVSYEASPAGGNQQGLPGALAGRREVSVSCTRCRLAGTCRSCPSRVAVN